MRTTLVARTALFGLGLAALMLAIGCQNSPPHRPPEEPRYSIQFVSDSTQDYCWVIFSDAATGAVINVHKLQANDTYNTGYEVPDRSTMTVAIKSEWRPLRTIYRAPAGHYRFDDRAVRESSIGRADVTANYPAGNWDRIEIHMPSATIVADTPWVSANTQVHSQMNILRLSDHDRFFAWAYLQGETNLCGWLWDQPFARNTTNTYAFNIDQPVPVQDITSTVPLQSLIYQLYYRVGTYPVSMTSAPPESGGTLFHLPLPPFPAEGKWLSYSGRSGADYFYENREFETIPSVLNVPAGSITTDYTGNGGFENIQVTGSADWLLGIWNNPVEPWSIWMVYAPVNLAQVSMPSLPDSVMADFLFGSSQFFPSNLALEDYDPQTSFDECVFMQFGPDAVETGAYTRYYRYKVSGPRIGSADSEPVLPSSRWPWKRGPRHE